MSLISAVSGTTINTTLQLPSVAVDVVRWSARDHQGRIVAKGQSAPSGALVLVSFTLPTEAVIPADGSKYTINATDGRSSVTEYFSVVNPQSVDTSHGIEVTYYAGDNFTDTLILPEPADSITVTASLTDGTPLFAQQTIDVSTPVKIGDNYYYRLNVSAVDTRTLTGWGTGTIVWKYLTANSLDAEREMHPFYTITPYAADFMNAIRKITDKANIGDANKYMEITSTDLLHATMRGADYVMQSPPVMGGFGLDQMPRMLRDYIVKAGAVDLLRSQYLAEGMSQGDFQGLGVQLNVDRTQYIDSLCQQLSSDLQNLEKAKSAWLSQGAPLGAQMASGKRPLGTLSLSTGPYSNMPMVPLPFITVGSGLYSFLRFGPLR